MAEFWAVIFILFCVAVLGLNALSLPANWILIALLGLWKAAHPAMDAGWPFFLGLVGIAGLGEALEFLAQGWGVKRYGGSTQGSWGAIIGAVVGSIVGAPILLGLGAIPGALLGAYFGGLFAERAKGRSWGESAHSAKGAFYGKFLGLVVKAGLGAAILILSIPRIWPG